MCQLSTSNSLMQITFGHRISCFCWGFCVAYKPLCCVRGTVDHVLSIDFWILLILISTLFLLSSGARAHTFSNPYRISIQLVSSLHDCIVYTFRHHSQSFIWMGFIFVLILPSLSLCAFHFTFFHCSFCWFVRCVTRRLSLSCGWLSSKRI